jgi:AcrR family transcriptional regulator
MLSFHFGSREGLLAAVVEEVERRQLEALRELTVGRSPRALMMAMHRRLTAPELAPIERLFFELYARGLQGDPGASFLVGPGIATWIEALTELYAGLGFSRRAAAAEATLALATSRGLLLDHLATGDRARIDAAARRYVEGVLLRRNAG